MDTSEEKLTLSYFSFVLNLKKLRKSINCIRFLISNSIDVLNCNHDDMEECGIIEEKDIEPELKDLEITILNQYFVLTYCYFENYIDDILKSFYQSKENYKKLGNIPEFRKKFERIINKNIFEKIGIINEIEKVESYPNCESFIIFFSLCRNCIVHDLSNLKIEKRLNIKINIIQGNEYYEKFKATCFQNDEIRITIKALIEVMDNISSLIENIDLSVVKSEVSNKDLIFKFSKTYLLESD